MENYIIIKIKTKSKNIYKTEFRTKSDRYFETFTN